MIEFTSHVRKLMKSPTDVLAGMTEWKMGILHAAVGIAGEVAEMLENILHRPIDVIPDLINEMGDVEFYMEALRQALTIDRGLTTAQAEAIAPGSLVNSLTTLSVEAGKLLDVVKKITINGNVKYATTDIISAMCKVEVELARVRNYIHVNRDTILNFNMEKLNKRYPTGYSDQAAMERKDDQS